MKVEVALYKNKTPTGQTVEAYNNLNHAKETNLMNNINTSGNNCPALVVPFHGDSLYLAKFNDEPYVPMRPIVESMGLDWAAQFTKIKQKFSTCVAEITMQLPNDNQRRSVSCLPLRKLPAWLYSINPNKVKPEISAKVVQYQNECDEVLWQYWTKGEVKKKDVRAAVKSYLPEFRQARAMDLATKAIGNMLDHLPNLGEQSKQVIYATVLNPIAGTEIIPLPVLENKTYTATEVGEMLGVTSNKVGRIANKLGLKVEEYGMFVLDKSRSSDKQVETFRYNDKAVEIIRDYLVTGGVAA